MCAWVRDRPAVEQRLGDESIDVAIVRELAANALRQQAALITKWHEWAIHAVEVEVAI